MRLLKRVDDTLNFVETPQPYAILSHTYGEREVTYQDVLAGKSNDKITFTLEQAARDDLEHIWIDTCCINKFNAVELGKAFNLMYEWYAKAEVCYAYLVDVFDGGVEFQHSRWFTRGWTLQEMLAPKAMRFYNRDGEFLGTREDLAASITSATGVPPTAFGNVQSTPIPQRYQWVTNRQTTEPEDMSYCMVGLLEVNLTFSYGMGDGEARQRLMNAVRKKHGTIILDQLQQTKYDLRDALDFENFRRDAIDLPVYNTCTWLTDHPAYLRWESGDTELLWIKGNPGAGKSTLMKYVESVNEGAISFYFNARGTQLDRTTVGMYRSLLVQLMDGKPGLSQHIIQRLKIKKKEVWQLPQLKEMFRVAISESHRVRCFIDALDESTVAEIRDMISFFRDLAKAYPQRFPVCFASRYYPLLTIKGSAEIRLEDQKRHMQDLETYVLDNLDCEDPRLQRLVIDKACGVFMWAVLAVKLLNEEYANGTLHAGQDLIQQLPQELDGVYRAIASRYGDGKFESCLQFLVCARNPPPPEELYHFILHGAEVNSVSPSREILERFVVSSSRGLARIVSDSVQFVHESVRDFLHQGGLEAIVHHDIAHSHDHIKTICAQYLKDAPDTLVDYNVDESSFTEESRDACIEQNLPFLIYAASMMTFHAEEAAKEISQEDFVRNFDWNILCRMLNESAVIDVFAVMNTPRLAAICVQHGHEFDEALEVALRHGSTAVAHQLLVYGADPAQLDQQGSTMLMVAMTSGSIGYPETTIWTPRVVNTTYSRMVDDKTVTLLPLSGDRLGVMDLLIAYDADIDQMEEETALILAVTIELDTLRCVQNRGASIDLTNDFGITALMHACTFPVLHAVEELPRRGADVNLCEANDQTALSYVVKSKEKCDPSEGTCRHISTMKGLLYYKAEDRSDKHGLNARVRAKARRDG